MQQKYIHVNMNKMRTTRGEWGVVVLFSYFVFLIPVATQ